MRTIRVILAVAAYFLVWQPCCRADSYNPFSVDKSGKDDSTNGGFIIPVSSRSAKQGKTQTTTTTIYTSPSSISVSSPQINIQSAPGVSSQSVGVERTVSVTSAPEINDLTKAAAEQDAPGSVTPAVDPADEGDTAPVFGRKDLSGEGDRSLVAVRRSAGKEHLSDEAGGSAVFYTAASGKDGVTDDGGLIPGSSNPDPAYGRENTRLDMPEEGALRQDYLSAFLRTGSAEKAAFVLKAGSERNGRDPGEYYIYAQDYGGDDQEGGYAGYYYNVENTGEGGTAKPGERKLLRKIIKPLKELFYKVSYFSRKEG